MNMTKEGIFLMSMQAVRAMDSVKKTNDSNALVKGMCPNPKR